MVGKLSERFSRYRQSVFKDRWRTISFVFLFSLLGFSLTLSFFFVDINLFDPEMVGTPQPPSWAHPLGTDDFGRDQALRLIAGAKVSMMVGVLSVGISLGIGVVYGLFSGFLGGFWDRMMMRFLDVFLAIPTLFLILTIQVMLTPSLWNVVVVIGLTSWMGVARLVRAEVLSIKHRPYILAVKARGFSSLRVLFVHILPNAKRPILVAAILGMAGAILTESVLSFLGLGVQPPYASWGNMLQDGLAYLRVAPWMTIAPGGTITLAILSLHFLGSRVR